LIRRVAGIRDAVEAEARGKTPRCRERCCRCHLSSDGTAKPGSPGLASSLPTTWLRFAPAFHACFVVTGDADAYGTMADCYTDMGEFEKAAVYYDKYIERMNRDGPI
jgi:pentatricopeptide repeat protein